MGWGNRRKILILWGFTKNSDFYGSSRKTNILGGSCLKGVGGVWTVCRFKRGLHEKKE